MLMMPNVLQYPVAHTAAVLAQAMKWINVNPLYTPGRRKLSAPAQGFQRAEAIIVLENFAPTAQAVLAKTSVKHASSARGDLPAEGRDCQFRGGEGRRCRRSWIPARSPTDAIAAGCGMKLQQADTATCSTMSPSRNIPAALPVFQGCDTASIAIFSPTCCRTMPGCSPHCRSRPSSTSCSSFARRRLSRVWCFTACYLLAVRCCHQSAGIPNPRDMAGFVKELSKYQVTFSRR